jgi:hypothetical protein
MLLQHAGRRQLAEVGMQSRQAELGDEGLRVPVAGLLAKAFDDRALQVLGTGELTLRAQGPGEGLRDSDGDSSASPRVRRTTGSARSRKPAAWAGLPCSM